MLKWFETGKELTDIGSTRKKFFENGLKNLSESEITDIKVYISDDVDSVLSSGKELYVPGHHAPKDWNGTSLQIIYDKAYPNDASSSALFYGLVCMLVLIERDDSWFAMKSNFNRDFDQMTYWLNK